jgi:uncharacterized membrane protein (UPF0127 family)
MKNSFIRRAIYSSVAILILVLLGWYYSREVYVGELNAGTLSIGNTTIVVETANTYTARINGLSGREGLDERAGMIFEFMDEDYHEFWMKDMKFPIDIIWLDKDFKVVDIKRDARPESYPESFSPKEKSKYVIEVVSGFADRHEVSIGQKVSYVDHAVDEK